MCDCCKTTSPVIIKDRFARGDGVTMIKTPDGERKCLRIDVHTHILPESWPNLKERYGYGGFITIQHTEPGKAKMYKDDGTFFRDIKDDCWSLERRIQECDAAGIDVQVLSTVPVMFSYWAKPEDCLDLSMMLNDHMAKCVAMYPKRFIGLGTLPMQAPALAAVELRRCVTELGLAGVQIGTHINNWTLAAPELDPVWQAAEETGACIFIHPWDMIGAGLMQKYFMPWLVGMPAETSLAICSMMFAGVFERFPKLRVLYAHGGGAFPCTVGRVQHGFEVRPDLCAVDCKLSPMEQLGKFWVDSLVHDAEAMELIVKVFGECFKDWRQCSHADLLPHVLHCPPAMPTDKVALFAGIDKICLGSDAPFVLGEVTPLSDGCRYAAGQLLDAMPWSDEKKAKILETNALNWLGRDSAAFL